MVPRKPASRSPSPWKVLLDNDISTPPGSGPDVRVIRYAAVAPAARLSIPT